MSDFKKRGLAKRTIKYTNKAGEEKKQYITVGEFFTEDDGSRPALKLLATATTDEVWLNIYPLEERDDTPLTQAQALNGGKDVVLKDIDDKPIDLSEIPF